MHFDKNTRSFQRRKRASSLTLCLLRNILKYLFFWEEQRLKITDDVFLTNRGAGKKSFKVKEKKTCETEFFTNFPLVTCASTLKDTNRDDKYRKYICILKYREEFLSLLESIKYMEKCTNSWNTNRLKHVPFF